MKKENKGVKNTTDQKVQPEEKAGVKDTRTEGGQTADVNVAEEGDRESAEANAAAEAAEWKDKYLRLSAEYDNYRKRTLREKLELINTGGEDVMKSMLEVLDDMDRALEAMQKSNELDALRQGMTLIYNKLHGTLKNKGLSEIEALGNELDTDLHDAVAKIEMADQEMKGKIVDVIQKGYKLKDKIIRHAKVVVCQ